MKTKNTSLNKTFLYLPLIFFFNANHCFSQSFVNNSVSAANSWNSSLTKTISVSGLPEELLAGTFELWQINIHLGSQTDGTYNYSRYNITLTSPEGTSIVIVSGNPNPISFPNSSVREVNSQFRDNIYLKFPNVGAFWEPWHIGYYRTYVANSFDSFLGENPNGEWILQINENSASNGARFNSVEIAFMKPFPETDYTGFSENDGCINAFCLRSDEIIIGTNNGFTSESSDMYNSNTAGCSWNAAQNNSAWFKFMANAPDVQLTISGLTGNLQILSVYSTGADPCNSSNNTVVSGGCPSDAINDTYLSPRYSNGSIGNMQLNLNGLNPGNDYYLIVDGTGGAISPFYLELSGASNSCGDFFPVELVDFTAIFNNQNEIEIKWETSSEANNDYFEIEKSTDNKSFESIGFVSGAGFSDISISYKLLYININQDNILYFRLKQVDFDGAIKYSRTISCKNPYLELSNPIVIINQSDEFIEITNINNAYSTIEIFDLQGRTKFNSKVLEKLIVPFSEIEKGINILKFYGTHNIHYEKVIIF
jgi:hypothetical protein